MRQLNNLQKQWLFDQHYMTAKTLDACVEPGRQSYFIGCFNWLIEESPNNGWHRLVLKSKNDNIEYCANLNLCTKYKTLMAIH